MPRPRLVDPALQTLIVELAAGRSVPQVRRELASRGHELGLRTIYRALRRAHGHLAGNSSLAPGEERVPERRCDGCGGKITVVPCRKCRHEAAADTLARLRALNAKAKALGLEPVKPRKAKRRAKAGSLWTAGARQRLAEVRAQKQQHGEPDQWGRYSDDPTLTEEPSDE